MLEQYRRKKKKKTRIQTTPKLLLTFKNWKILFTNFFAARNLQTEISEIKKNERKRRRSNFFHLSYR